MACLSSEGAENAVVKVTVINNPKNNFNISHSSQHKRVRLCCNVQHNLTPTTLNDALLANNKNFIRS
jgi:hypothetical protein